MTQAYGCLAEWFEILNDDCDYRKWSQYFVEGLGRRNATGGDISDAMLSKAVRLSREEGLPIPFVKADAAALKTAERYDFLLSANDCINYLPQGKLSSAFRHIASCLKKRGIFWFDVSSEYKLREKVANNMFGDDRDEVTYLEFNTLKEDRVETDVTLFVKEGGHFRRYDEKHTRYIHTEEALCNALAEAGFRAEVEGDLGANKFQSDRLNFICEKVSS